MKPLLALASLALICPPHAAHAQDPADLAKLKDAYQNKIEEVTKPVHDKYIDALKALERRLAAAGQLEDALKVREARVAAAAAAPRRKPLPFADERDEGSAVFRDVEKLTEKLSGSRWTYHYAGQDIGERRELEFRDGGLLVVFSAAKGATALRPRDQGTWSIRRTGEVTLSVPEWKDTAKVQFASDLSHYWGYYSEKSLWRFGVPAK